jgi:hypothetical protein
MRKLTDKIRGCLLGIALGASILILGTCLGEQNTPAEKDDWDAGNGMVSVRIPLGEADNRTSPGLDDISALTLRSVWIDYYEAVFRDQGTGAYYVGRAFKGVSYLTVNVKAEQSYDIPALAGTSLKAGTVSIF